MVQAKHLDIECIAAARSSRWHVDEARNQPVPASAGSELAFPCLTVSFVRFHMQERLSAYASV